jgi:4-aminobutyrate--pyruvate transaminase
MVSDPIYAAMVKQSEKIGVFSHGFTFGGHPVCAAVALETLRIYQDDDTLSHVRRMAPLMQAGLRRFADHPLVGEVRGIGLIGAVELVANKTTKAPFDAALGIGPFLVKRAQHHGLILRALGDTVAFCPPLIIKPAEIDLMLDRFALALQDTAGMVQERCLAANHLVSA